MTKGKNVLCASLGEGALILLIGAIALAAQTAYLRQPRSHRV